MNNSLISFLCQLSIRTFLSKAKKIDFGNNLQDWIEIISQHERKQYKKCLHYSEYFLTCHYINYGPIIYKVGRPDCRFLPHALYIPHYLSLQPWLQINKISVWYFIFIDSKLCWTDLTKYIFHASSVVFSGTKLFLITFLVTIKV